MHPIATPRVISPLHREYENNIHIIDNTSFLNGMLILE